MAEIISTAVAPVAAFVLGYGVRGEREAQVSRRRRHAGDAPAATHSYTDTFLDPDLIDPRLLRRLRRNGGRR